MTAISSPTRERVTAPASRADAFTAARRHSARVRALRLLVPAAGVVSVVVVLAGWWYSTATIPELAITDVTVTDEGIAMDAPVLRGEDDDGRPYELRAAEAFQSLSVNPVITMRQLEGEMTIDDGEQAIIVAPQARFDSETQLMVFEEGGVELRLSSGGQAFLGVSEVDLENGTLRSQEPVRIASDEVTLDAGGVQGFDGGERLLFTDGVRMVFTPAQDDASVEAQDGT